MGVDAQDDIPKGPPTPTPSQGMDSSASEISRVGGALPRSMAVSLCDAKGYLQRKHVSSLAIAAFFYCYYFFVLIYFFIFFLLFSNLLGEVVYSRKKQNKVHVTHLPIGEDPAVVYAKSSSGHSRVILVVLSTVYVARSKLLNEELHGASSVLEQ